MELFESAGIETTWLGINTERLLTADRIIQDNVGMT